MSKLQAQVKEVLLQLQSQSIAEIAGYDAKNDWLDPSLPPWEKLRRYYTAEESMGQARDCDVSLRSTVICAIAFGGTPQLEWHLIGHQKFWYKDHWETEANKFCLCDPDHDWELRGDTMHSPSTTLGVWAGDKSGRAFLRELDEKSWNSLSPEGQRFLELVHTPGNFILVPFQGAKTRSETLSFNSARGTGPAKDYWDLTLLAIYHHYFPRCHLLGSIAPDGSWQATHTLWQLVGEKNVPLAQAWLGNLSRTWGWGFFVVDNLLQDFVNTTPEGDFGPPRGLWGNHFVAGALPENRARSNVFFANAAAQIAARGQRVAICVKQKLQGKSEEGIPHQRGLQHHSSGSNHRADRLLWLGGLRHDGIEVWG